MKTEEQIQTLKNLIDEGESDAVGTDIALAFKAVRELILYYETVIDFQNTLFDLIDASVRKSLQFRIGEKND